jgi:hypothetical protein
MVRSSAVNGLGASPGAGWLGLVRAHAGIWRWIHGLFLFGAGVGTMLTFSVNVAQSGSVIAAVMLPKVLLQASAAIVGLLLPVIAVIFYLAVSMIYLIEPFREVDIHAPRAVPPGKP